MKNKHNKSVRNIILSVISLALCAVIVVAAVQLTVTVVRANSSAGSGSEDLDGYDVVFTGNITIYDEPYDVTLAGRDGSFTVDANSIKNVMDGTYTFTDGQGWTFTFNDSRRTNVRSQYDADSKTHRFVYALDLGSRGAGDVLLTREDDDFTPAPQPWEDIPSFSGTASWFDGALSAETVCSCNADGEFSIFCTGGEIDEIDGTYVQAEDQYQLTTQDGTVYSTSTDPDTGLPAFTIPVHRPSLEVYGAADTEVTMVLNTAGTEEVADAK